MKIAIASGKGGTGKTTIATNLAVVLARTGETVTYIDCDVEEPNGHLFLKPRIDESRPVNMLVPDVDFAKCTGCGRCGEICQYSAIACIAEQVMTFTELCHSCGGCALVCPENAISEVPLQIGTVETGTAQDGVRFVHGRLDVGKPLSPPVIKAVRKEARPDGVTILDASPGTSCPVIEAVRDVDYLILVTEPTPFGLNDLRLAVEMARRLGLRFGVAINRSTVGDDKVREYCTDEHIELIVEIPDERSIAEAYSRGALAVDAVPEYRADIDKLVRTVHKSTAETSVRE
ncbi:MAG: ATP-binding protein [Candidatus Hydrogenedentes bacterium]|nr:ATP-binding protein [Candidatus Hydrogenedentota bacterium]